MTWLSDLVALAIDVAYNVAPYAYYPKAVISAFVCSYIYISCLIWPLSGLPFSSCDSVKDLCLGIVSQYT